MSDLKRISDGFAALVENPPSESAMQKALDVWRNEGEVCIGIDHGVPGGDKVAVFSRLPGATSPSDWLRKFVEREPPFEPTWRGEPVDYVHFDEPPWPVRRMGNSWHGKTTRLFRTSGRDVAKSPGRWYRGWLSSPLAAAVMAWEVKA